MVRFELWRIQFLRPNATGRMAFSAALVLKDRMIQEASEPIPERQCVVAGFGQSALWQSLAFGVFIQSRGATGNEMNLILKA